MGTQSMSVPKLSKQGRRAPASTLNSVLTTARPAASIFVIVTQYRTEVSDLLGGWWPGTDLVRPCSEHRTRTSYQQKRPHGAPSSKISAEHF